MFEKYHNLLLFELKDASVFRLVPSAEERESWDKLPDDCRKQLIRDAEYALGQSIPVLPASMYMRYQKTKNQDDYAQAYFARRDMLCALVMAMAARPDARFDERIADLIWSICEESSWVLPANNPLSMGEDSMPLPDIYQPLIDSAAANTAFDLCMVVQMLGERICEAMSPQLVQRIVYEVDRRIIAPFMEAPETSWLCGSRVYTAQCLRGVMMAFLCFVDDDRQRWHCMEKAWGLLSDLLSRMPQDGSIPDGVSEWLNTAGPIVDCLTMMRVATCGKVDLRRELQIQLMCHYPVLCHIAQGWFVNTDAHSMKPELSGPAIYRIGMEVRDAALCDLGAFLLRTQGEGEKEPLLMHRCINALYRESIEEDKSAPPFRMQGCLNAQSMLVARMKEDDEHGLALAVYGGHNGQIGGHLDAGNMLLFAHGQPVLVDAGCFEETHHHNLPRVASCGQLSGAVHRAEDVVYQLEDDFAAISMNLAPLYPPQAKLISWQRSAVYNRVDGVVQLVEIFDLHERKAVEFNFITPCRVNVGEGFAQIGPVRMKWEKGLKAEVEELEVKEEQWTRLWGSTLRRLTLTAEKPALRGHYTFTFNALRTFG